MRPDHPTAIAAAKRVKAATEAGDFAAVDDALAMHTYQLSMELRRLPARDRLLRAKTIARHIVENTEESVDDGEAPKARRR
jgi:hypothetical protein